MIYLDNNATTAIDKKVLEEMLPYLSEEYANPSSMYDFAKKPASAIRESRVKMREFLVQKMKKRFSSLLVVPSLLIWQLKEFLIAIKKNDT